MILLELVLSVDKTEKGINSILPMVSLLSISQQLLLFRHHSLIIFTQKKTKK